MNFTADDFPLYQHLVKLDAQASMQVQKDFAAATAGGEGEKYSFALGIQTVAANVPLGQIPGVTEEMNLKTLRSCLAIFKDVAGGTSAQAANAKQMVDYLVSRDLSL